MSLGQLFSLQIYSFFIFGPLQELGNIINVFRETEVSLDNFQAIIDTPKEPRPEHPVKINGIENFPGSTLTAYNRWGNKLYSNDDYKNEWKPDVTSGTYFYILNLKDGRKFNGFFQVFKD